MCVYFNSSKIKSIKVHIPILNKLLTLILLSTVCLTVCEKYEFEWLYGNMVILNYKLST